MARRVPLFATSRIGSTWESFFQPAHKVIVRVPATTSNLGPGFDSFGLALDMTNVLTVERADKFSIEVHGVGAEADDRIPADESNIIVQSCTKAMNMFTKAGEQPFEGAPPLRFESLNCVPSMSGLGSSSNALVLGMAAGLALSGKEVYSPNTKKLLLQLASDEEGHADNISAAIYGGFQVNFKAPTSDRSYQFITQRVHVPKGLHCVLFIPDKAQDRDEARAVMPTGYSRDDTIHNIGRAAMLVNCFATGQFDALRFAMEDRVHQPYRSRFFPVEDLIDAALAAGAHGAFLSSQGPTVVAICGGTAGLNGDVGGDTMSQFLAESVSDAMEAAAKSRGFSGQVHVAMPSDTGLVSSGFAEDGTPLWGPEWEEAQKEKMYAGIV